MKKIISFVICFLFPYIVTSQSVHENLYHEFESRINSSDTNQIEQEIQNTLKKAISNKDTLGILCYQLSELKYLSQVKDHQQFLNVFSELIPVSRQFKNDSLTALTYYYCGDFFYEVEDMVNASRMFNKSVEYFIKAKKPLWLCRTDIILGIIKMIAEKYNEAISVYKDYIYKVKVNKFNLPLSGVYNNIGICHIYLKEYKIALNYFDTSYVQYSKEENIVGIGRIFNNKGTVFLETGKLNQALSYFEKSYKIRKKNNVGKSSYSESIINIGKAQYALGRVSDAKINFEKGIEIAKEINSKELQKRGLEKLKEVYYKQGNFKKAYELQKDYYRLVDTLYGQHIRDELHSYEISGKFNRKIIKDSIEQSQRELFHNEELRHQKAVQEQKNAKNNIIKTFLILIILMIGIVLIILFRRFKEKKKNNIIILRQKEELQQKQMEIVDSINYAKHLQDAILPSAASIELLLPDSFVFYQPKAIVAGDFYWIEKSDDKMIIAVADCTGHGVPGAMVSMICHGALNRAVREFQLSDTGLILEKTRDLVAEYFIQSEKDIRDGMDIAICILDLPNKKIQYSGANNPLWYVRDNDVFEIKASKQSVGKTPKYFPFETHEIQVRKNDVYYLFTDGFADQFGGVKGKKYKYRNFKQFLNNISSRSMKDQKKEINNEFSRWKGEFEQVDDVCIMGIRI